MRKGAAKLTLADNQKFWPDGRKKHTTQPVRPASVDERTAWPVKTPPKKRAQRNPTAAALSKRKMKSVERQQPYKPDGYEGYYSFRQMCVEIGRSLPWMRKMEREGIIPRAARVPRGTRFMRLYSPEQVDEIRRIMSQRVPRGRPSTRKLQPWEVEQQQRATVEPEPVAHGSLDRDEEYF